MGDGGEGSSCFPTSTSRDSLIAGVFTLAAESAMGPPDLDEVEEEEEADGGDLAALLLAPTHIHQPPSSGSISSFQVTH